MRRWSRCRFLSRVGRLLLWLIAGLSGGLCPAQNTNPIVIGGFDANRSGQASFPDGAAFSQARTAILGYYPAASFAGFAELTASNLAGVQVLVVGSPAGSSSATSPLSAAEQTALLQYVQNGGAAMVFTDHESFAPESAAANASLLAPFGLSGGGTLISEVVATPSRSGGASVAARALRDGPGHGAICSGRDHQPGPACSEFGDQLRRHCPGGD